MAQCVANERLPCRLRGAHAALLLSLYVARLPGDRVAARRPAVYTAADELDPAGGGGGGDCKEGGGKEGGGKGGEGGEGERVLSLGRRGWGGGAGECRGGMLDPVVEAPPGDPGFARLRRQARPRGGEGERGG